MNRMEFFRQLEYLLRELPESERMDALAYYNDYFDEAGVENEQKVIRELGSPDIVAQRILEDYRAHSYKTSRDYSEPELEKQSTDYQEQNPYENYLQPQYQQEQQKKKKLSTGMIVLIVVLAILAFPIWIGIVAGLFGALVGVLGGLFGVVVGIGGAAIGLVAAAIACIVAGVFAALAVPMEGLTMIGVGSLLLAVGVMLILLFVLVTCHWLPLLVRTIVKWIKGLRHRAEGGNEI